MKMFHRKQMAAGGRQGYDAHVQESRSDDWRRRADRRRNRDGGERGGVIAAPEEWLVRLRSLTAFALGYVLGSKAGRERYGQIIAAAKRASERLEEYSLAGADGTAANGRTRPTNQRVNGRRA